MNTRSLSILAVFILAGLARAEINFGECIEWIVADSERVVVGKITKIEKAAPHEIVTVDVSKTFRGKHEEKLRFVVRGWGDNAAQGWMKANVPMLFCLVKQDRIKENKDLPDHLFLRYGTNTQCAAFLGKTDQRVMDVFTRDFGHLKDPAAIIKHVETYAKTIPADWKRKHVIVDLPPSPAYGKLWAGSVVFFKLPVDAALEAQGRRWCKSKNPDHRACGVLALKPFRNELNIKILKGLLTDGAYATGSGKKSYYVRASAYDVLREFGVKVERPVLEEPAK